MVEGLFRRFRHNGMSEDDAFRHSVESITGGALSFSSQSCGRLISKQGPCAWLRSHESKDCSLFSSQHGSAGRLHAMLLAGRQWN